MLTVLTQEPLFSTDKPSDAHHLRRVQPRAFGRKASDEFAVPLCRSHHRAVYRARDERAWWQTADVDSLKAACKLWRHTRVNEGRTRLEPTMRADSDILRSWMTRRPSKVVLIIDTRVGQLFHMTGGVSRIIICKADGS